MMKFAAFVLALGLALASDSKPACFDQCRFQFCKKATTFKVGKADVSFTGAICAKSGTKIGHMDEKGEVYYVKTHKRAVRISKWHPSGMKQKFSPSFFKSFDVFVHGKRFSGIGHEKPQQNQTRFLNRKCFAVPLRSYQVLDKKGNVVKNVHPRGNPLHDCVAFTTFTH